MVLNFAFDCVWINRPALFQDLYRAQTLIPQKRASMVSLDPIARILAGGIPTSGRSSPCWATPWTRWSPTPRRICSTSATRTTRSSKTSGSCEESPSWWGSWIIPKPRSIARPAARWGTSPSAETTSTRWPSRTRTAFLRCWGSWGDPTTRKSENSPQVYLYSCFPAKNWKKLR